MRGRTCPVQTRTIFARAQQPGRLVFVLLRGGLDGLAAVVPYGDPVYRATRGSLAYDARNLVPLSPLFGLSPGLAPLRELWDRDELVVLHAMAIPYRTRSHFEAQAVLESGTVYPATPADGWVNRLVRVMSGNRSGIAIASGMPQSLSCGPDVQGLSSIRAVDVRISIDSRAYRTTACAGRFEAALHSTSPSAKNRWPLAGLPTVALAQVARRSLR